MSFSPWAKDFIVNPPLCVERPWSRRAKMSRLSKVNAVSKFAYAAVLCTLGLSTAPLAEERSLGQILYEANCAACHGDTGKGDGEFGKLWAMPVARLDTLSKENGGVFPFERTYKVIDGRLKVKGHGERMTPIWGDVFTLHAIQEYGPFFGEFYANEHIVRGRILALIEYLHELQE